MNIQIFGKTKCFETKKAERYFKERGIKFQSVDMIQKGLSKGEFNSIVKALGSYESIVDDKCKDRELLVLFQYLSEEDKENKLLENPKLFKTPIIRNGKKATVGFQPDVWKNWD